MKKSPTRKETYYTFSKRWKEVPKRWKEVLGRGASRVKDGNAG
jgi:hypothetical protein